MGNLPAVLAEMGFHLTVMSMVYGIAILLLVGFVGLPLYFIRGAPAFSTFLVRLVFFFGALLIVGVAANGVWASVVWNKMYVSRDPVVTFVPFFPFGQWVLNQTWAGRSGDLLGGWSILEVQAVWWALSVFVWAATIAIFASAVRRFRVLAPNWLIQADPNPTGFGPLNSDR